MRQDWWEFLKIGFYRAERYYKTKQAAGELPDGFRIQDLDIELYGHEFITSFLQIVDASKDIIQNITELQFNDYLRQVVATTWRDFISFFVFDDKFDVSRFEDTILTHQPNALIYHNLQNKHLILLFVKLALYKWRYPFSNQGVYLIDINEKLDEFIERLKIASSHAALTELPIPDPKVANEFDQKIHQIYILAFNLGVSAGIRQGSKQIPELARRQLIANSDKQAKELFPVLHELIDKHNAATLQEVADKLNERKILTKNGNIWNATNVKILIERANKLFPEDPISLKKDAYFESLKPIVEQIRKNGAKTLTDIAQALNEEEIPSKQGKIWHASTVKLLLERIDKVSSLGVN